MINIDFHIHTVSTKWESSFEFDIESLSKYIRNNKLDVISITNHNIFDKNNYEYIKNKIDISVYPGIELSVDNFHILVIANDADVDDFTICCEQANKIFEINEVMSIEEFKKIFHKNNNFLYIPHYEKRPRIQKNLIDKMGVKIFCGEVSNQNQFIRMKKSEDNIIPVLFSDFRASDRPYFPMRSTFVDINSTNFMTIKEALKDKDKVHINRKFENSLFQILSDGTCASTGLNVIIGKRSSGKTYTINQIYNNFVSDNNSQPNIKYIKQFELIEKDENKANEEFDRRIASEQTLFSDEYLKEFKQIVDEVQTIRLEDNITELDEYLFSLLDFANNTEKHDVFAKVPIFSEQDYPIHSDSEIKELIKSLLMLLESNKYKDIIEEYLPQKQIKLLLLKLIDKYEESEISKYIKKEVNSIIKQVKKDLSLKSNQTPTKTFNIIKHAKDTICVNEFIELSKTIQKEKIIKKEEVGKFTIIAKRKPINSTTELQKRYKTQGVYKDAYKNYEEPYRYLGSLVLTPQITNDQIYKGFVNIEYAVLNADGYPVSGGQRTEFLLEEKLKDAEKYDMLLIDEVESSFDNIFLNENINAKLKYLSTLMPVFVSTHNSTVGVSIKPNYLIYTETCNNKGNTEFYVYSGEFLSKSLHTVKDKTISNHDVMMNCFEGGDVTYEERRTTYESTKN